jgi:tetratricopeptide (TPR) repeat protein
MITEETVAPVVRICRALDGIPLAIELAAARLRALTPWQVADRLDDRFRLLSVGNRGVLPRHQTLRAIVDWSWELLDEAERVTLRRLSVFSGGATPESAERVCALGGDQSGVIDVISSLTDKSLVVVTGDPQVRYRLLETVRAYAAERLAEAGEEDLVRAAHAAYFLDLAERAEPELRGHDQIEWLTKLATEHDNCAAALRHAVSTRDGALGVRLVAALAWFWMLRDYDSEAAQWAKEVHEVTGDTPPPGQADAHTICAFMAVISGREKNGFLGPTEVREALEHVMPQIEGTGHPLVAMATPVLAVLSGDQELAQQRLAQLAEHPEPWTRAAQQMFRGHLSVNTGDIEEAAQNLTAGLAEFKALGDRWGMIVALTGLGEVALARGRPADAIKVLEEARSHASEDFAGPWGEAMCVHLGRARARLGDTAGARADLERGMRIASRTGNRDDETTAYIELSELARTEGDVAGARELLEQALAIAEPLAQRPDMCVVAAAAFSKLGCVCEQEGDLEAAAGRHAKALAALTTGGVLLLPSNTVLGVVVEGFAALAAARGQLSRAVELLGLAHTLQGFSHPDNLEVARVTAATKGLDRAEFEAAYARGRAMSREEALSLAP